MQVLPVLVFPSLALLLPSKINPERKKNKHITNPTYASLLCCISHFKDRVTSAHVHLAFAHLKIVYYCPRKHFVFSTENFALKIRIPHHVEFPFVLSHRISKDPESELSYSRCDHFSEIDHKTPINLMARKRERKMILRKGRGLRTELEYLSAIQTLQGILNVGEYRILLNPCWR